MYRDVEKVAKSVSRSSQVAPPIHHICKVGRLCSWLSKIMLRALGVNGSDYCAFAKNGLVICILLSVLPTSVYLDARHRGLDIRAVHFKDLVALPLDMCRIVVEFCHLPVSLAEQAVKGFEIDSQRNSIIAKCVIGCFMEAEITPQTKAMLNKLLKKYELPLTGEPEIIEGTLTYS